MPTARIVLLVLMAAGGGVAAIRTGWVVSNANFGPAQEFARRTIVDVTLAWDAGALERRMAPSRSDDARLARLSDTFRPLGTLQTVSDCVGGTGVGLSAAAAVGTDNRLRWPVEQSFSFTCKAEYERGGADVTVAGQKTDGGWRVERFEVRRR